MCIRDRPHRDDEILIGREVLGQDRDAAIDDDVLDGKGGHYRVVLGRGAAQQDQEDRQQRQGNDDLEPRPTTLQSFDYGVHVAIPLQRVWFCAGIPPVRVSG